MTTGREHRLAHDQLELKLATEKAIRAAGGQSHLAEQTSRAQSCWSDYQSKNTLTFIPADMIGEAEDRGQGQPGHPHVTRALARRQGFVLFPMPSLTSGADPRWSIHIGAIAKETGDVVAGLCADLADDNELSPREARRRLPDIDDAIAALSALRGAVADVAREAD